MAQYQYLLHFKDEQGNIISPVTMHFVDFPEANSVEIVGGTNSIDSDQPTLDLKFTASGFKDLEQALTPGTTNIVMAKLDVGQNNKTTEDKEASNKWMWIILVVVLLIVLAVWYFKFRTKQPAA